MRNYELRNAPVYFYRMPVLERIRKATWSKYFTWGLLLGFLNLSIDPPDREAPGQREDTTINEIESLVELIAEQWLGIDDFLPEHDESDDSGFLKKGLGYRCTRHVALISKPAENWCVVTTYLFADRFTAQYEPEPRVPPPWA